MRRRPLFWLFLSVLCFISAAYFWQLGDQWAEKKPDAISTGTNQLKFSNPASNTITTTGALYHLGQSGSLSLASASTIPSTGPLFYRLKNTPVSLGELSHRPRAILLENALVDTMEDLALPIPDHLRSQGDAGAYIVQSRSTLDNSFRQALAQAGASIISYIPNNAYLVRASSDVIQLLKANSQVAAVLAYEPYFKLHSSLLKLAVEQAPLPEQTDLNVLMFPGTRDDTVAALKQLGAQPLAEETSPFGPVIKVHPTVYSLASIAALPGVQRVEKLTRRVSANDLSRAALQVSVDSVATNNYLDLTGTNVLVMVNDTGVDPTQPDLIGRVLFDPNPQYPGANVDVAGHGTFVAGIIAGDGSKSLTVSNASGSVIPTVDKQFRGKAPGARVFATAAVTDTGLQPSDMYLQELAARTNALISNNSWTYEDNSYDLAAASYDAAVRDALPTRTGSQPVLFVFPSGNAGEINSYFGGANEAGLGGISDEVRSPGTAKNVITVGAVEQQRNITNEVIVTVDGQSVTNALWQPLTDSSDEVAGYSSRGNVGVGIEGDLGRFKPDVVAPGSFVVSTTSTNWDQAAYYNPLTRTVSVLPNLISTPGLLFGRAVFVPESAVRVSISVVPNRFSPVPFPSLPIYVSLTQLPTGPGDADFVKNDNQVVMPPDGGPVPPGGKSVYYAIDNLTGKEVPFNLVTELVLTNQNGDVGVVLSNMNSSLGPFYRYESGTSMAAGGVAGSLALLQEFYEQRAHLTNSPAMMKALLINGARSLGNLYSLQVQTTLNHQGWGIPQLPNSAHPSVTNLTATDKSLLLFDQNATTALATGQTHTRKVQVAPEAQGFPMRVTLVWTDPPGNPSASIKLVNNLDLVVTNLDTGEVFFGNDIEADKDFNGPWDTNNPPVLDVVNNVENVYLQEDLGTNYSISVIGRAVNVNAVPSNKDNVVQDYALVISSGNGEITNAFKLTETPVVYQTTPLVTVITNTFQASPGYSGGLLTGQHAGASTPLLGTNTVSLGTGKGQITTGMTNQWHFYAITNDTTFTNAAFLTFLPPNLALPRMGVTNTSIENASRPEADIDLYVTKDGSMTNLSLAAISAAEKSLGPGGTETIVVSNATPGVYYLGVKSEDQQAAEYAVLGVFSLLPFSENQGGNLKLNCFPLYTAIPDGSSQKPGGAMVFGIAVEPITIHRVIVSNIITHELMGDLVGTLSHSGAFAVLNNHSRIGSVTNQMFIYDDSDQKDVTPYYQRTDGPGSLMNFGSKQGIGQWLLTQVDNEPGHIGTNVQLFVYLEKQLDPLEGFDADILPGACRQDFVEVPGEATQLKVEVSQLAGTGPISVRVCPLDGLDNECVSGLITNFIGTTLSIDATGNPALQPGTYVIQICNNGNDAVTVHVKATLEIPDLIQVSEPSSTGLVPIKDDAITYASINITNHQRISSADIGLLINHPRISDLAITLISPNGTRALLFENRGGTSAGGLGSFSTPDGEPIPGLTNTFEIYRTDFNSISAGPYAPGTLVEDWSVRTDLVSLVPDYTLPWLYNQSVVLANGSISNALPTLATGNYRLSFEVNHAPFLTGTVSWWPLDGDASDVFSGLDGLLLGNVQFPEGKVGQAFFGDGQATRMIVPRAPELNVGQEPGFTIEGWIQPSNVTNAAPIMQWSDYSAPTNHGVQLWLTDLSATNLVPGAFSLVLWDINTEPHYISTGGEVLTNGGWQHIAVSYDSPNNTARLYLNGALLTSQVFTNFFVPNTTGDLYFGFDPTTLPVGTAFAGGLDEFGLYNRALTDCEVAAIYNAGDRGKYGTNVLTCPVTAQVNVDGTLYTFTNGLTWGAGPMWETNYIDLQHSSNARTTVQFGPSDPNVALDNITLSTLVTNAQDGAVHFTDDTNVATVPIKFAIAPYQMPNFTNFSGFASGFVDTEPRTYDPGDTITGTSNGVPNANDWIVKQGAVTVISNTVLGAPLTNSVVLGNGSIETQLPTTPGRRYRVHYNVRGPGAVSWWNGDINPLDRRAFDLLGGNDGEFIGNVNSLPPGYVTNSFPGRTNTALYFDGPVTVGNAGKIELGDPQNLRLTNAFTIEGWILPLVQTNAYGTEQILFRGDSRSCLDPYYLSLEKVDNTHSDLRFHIESDIPGSCGIDVITTGGLITRADPAGSQTNWQHVTAIFEPGISFTTQEGTNTSTVITNQLRLYLNGLLVASTNTGLAPFRDLDPAFSPGMSLGNRSRSDYSQPFRGYIDELTVYGRALTPPEIQIVSTNRAGKADLTVPTSMSLAKLEVLVDDVVLNTAYGDNSGWTDYSFLFTAQSTNSLLTLHSLLPGTLVQGIAMVEVPSELSYRPEQSLDIFNGMDAFGTWTLEIWDKRTGATNNFPMLVRWQLDFKLKPLTVPAPIELQHGLPFVGSVAPGGVSTFFVDVPLWAQRATNILLSATDSGGNPLNLGVLYNTNFVPVLPTNALFWPPVNQGTNVLSPGGNPQLLIGQPYYLSVTNTNTLAATFSLGVWFDITTLANCESLTSFVGPAGVPRYFQFDVPTNNAPADFPPQAVSFWLTGANTNLTVVLSEHLPLPDLSSFDYISQAPSTNDEVVMVVTNSTPYKIQTNRWYVGVFNSGETNVPFSVQACSDTNNPTIIPLALNVPFTADLTNAFVAPPGPPRRFFFKVQIDNPVSAVLFELYGLSGDANLVLQKDVPPAIAPYLDGSFAPGRSSDQIVLRTNASMPDLRGTYYLGVYNTEISPVAYTLRATVPDSDGFLVTAQPYNATFVPLSPTNALLSFHAVQGEEYTIQFSPGLSFPIAWTTLFKVMATTPLATIELPVVQGQTGFYRIVQTNENPVEEEPILTISRFSDTQIRIAWSTLLVGYHLQYSDGDLNHWTDWTGPIGVEGPNYVVYDTIQIPGMRFYRLIKRPVAQEPTLSVTRDPNTGLVRIAWSTQFPDYHLQYTDGDFTNWKDWDLQPITIDTNTAEYVTFDDPTTVPRFYRLTK